MNNVDEWKNEWVLTWIRNPENEDVNESISIVSEFIEQWQKIPMEQMMHFALLNYNNHPNEAKDFLTAIDNKFNEKETVIDFGNLPAQGGIQFLKINCKVLNPTYLEDGKLVPLP